MKTQYTTHESHRFWGFSFLCYIYCVYIVNMKMATENPSKNSLTGYTSTAFLPWRMSRLILGSLVTLPAAILVLFFHETPHWLAKKGKLGEARYKVTTPCLSIYIPI